MHYAAFIVGAAAVGSIIYFATNKNEEPLPESKYQKELIAEQSGDVLNHNDKKETQENSKIESVESLSNNEIEKSEDNIINTEKKVLESIADKDSETKTNEASVEKNKETAKEVETIPSRGVDANNEKDNTPSETKRRFVAGTITKNEICEGDYIKIQNNDQEGGVVRIKAMKTDLTIPAGQFTEIKLPSSDYIYFLNEQGEVIERKQIIVHATPEVDFTFEANLYESGLPVTFFDAYGSFKKYEWDFGNGQKATGAETQVSFYSKGDFDVQLKVTDHNNCTTTKTRKVEIEKEYNLMASNAFRPNDHDIRTRTFMPYALTQRDVNFELVIVDPKTHAVIFKSKDASKGWDGTDQRTGQMTKANTTYVWKVHLENPEPGEKAIYMGTVVLKK